MSLRADKQTNIIDARVLRNVNFLFYFSRILKSIQNCRIKIFHQFLIRNSHEFFEKISSLTWFVDLVIHHVLVYFLLCSVSPFVLILSLPWGLTREVNEFFVSSGTQERIENRDRIFYLFGCFLELLKPKRLITHTELSNLPFKVIFLLVLFFRILWFDHWGNTWWCITESTELTLSFSWLLIPDVDYGTFWLSFVSLGLFTAVVFSRPS